MRRGVLLVLVLAFAYFNRERVLHFGLNGQLSPLRGVRRRGNQLTKVIATRFGLLHINFFTPAACVHALPWGLETRIRHPEDNATLGSVSARRR